MENPIGRKKREKLEEISLEAKGINEKLNSFTVFIEDFDKIKEQVNILFEFMVEENTEPTATEIKEMEEAQAKVQKEIAEQMEITIQNALINLVNKPENQTAITNFANQFSQGMQGKGQLSGIMLEDGSVNWVAALEKFMSGRGVGQPQLQGQPQAQRKGKSTGY